MQPFSLCQAEQLNVHLRMLRQPHKKGELVITNNVLKVATKLLKEMEKADKKGPGAAGLLMNKTMYNIVRVFVVSALSAVVSEMLGFKMKMWKPVVEIPRNTVVDWSALHPHRNYGPDPHSCALLLRIFMTGCCDAKLRTS